MAGLYPDYPDNRIAYELLDAKWYDTAGPSEYDISVSASTNSENFAWNWAFYGTGGNQYKSLLFPFNMDITHIHFSGGRAGLTQWSADTTNGIDGTWSGLSVPTYGASVQSARQNIYPVSLPACKAIQLYMDPGASNYTYVQAVHLYGKPTAGQNPDRIEIWHPTLDQRVSGGYFDWGDAPRTSTADRVFRIKNLSDIFTANTVTVSSTALTDASPSFAGTHLFSTGGSFTATVAISSILPGQISGPITVRRTTPSNAQLSLWTTRIKAEAGSWA
jgi:hypothetical protein